MVLARRRISRPAASVAKAYVLPNMVAMTTDDPLDPCFLEELEAIAVMPAESPARTHASNRSLASVRGYQREDLFAVAEVAYTYLFGGHERLARVLFDGLAAVAPQEPYFALALGLAHDLLDESEAADAWYRRAAKLDPTNPRPDVNRAELFIERARYDEAHRLLQRALKKVDDDPALADKIDALLLQLRRVARRAQP